MSESSKIDWSKLEEYSRPQPPPVQGDWLNAPPKPKPPRKKIPVNTILLAIIAIASVCAAGTVIKSKMDYDAAMDRVSKRIIEQSKMMEQAKKQK